MRNIKITILNTIELNAYDDEIKFLFNETNPEMS